jgi:outer membrane protein assembly factor BamB
LCRRPDNKTSQFVIDEKTSKVGKGVTAEMREVNTWDLNKVPLITEEGTTYGFKDGKYRMIDKDGNEKWAADLPDGFWKVNQTLDPSGNLYVMLDYSTIIKFSPDGKEQWQVKKDKEKELLIPNLTWGPDGTTYVSGNFRNHHLYAINPDGTEKWAHEKHWNQYPSIKVGPDGTIFTGGEEDEISAFSPADGSEIRTFPNEDSGYVTSFDILPGGHLIVARSLGNITCYGSNRQEIVDKILAKADEPPLKVVNNKESINIGGATLNKRNPKF